MKLKTCNMHLGTTNYPMELSPRFHDMPNGNLSEEALDAMFEELSKQWGSGPNWRTISGAALKARIKHHVTMTEQRYPGIMADGSDLVIPATTQVLGNGFSVVWTH